MKKITKRSIKGTMLKALGDAIQTPLRLRGLAVHIIERGRECTIE